ncbi:hypothetical protein G7046_g9344 [Stylonectria norvegica]|nr:hypothetical protein G7046_g9344 [Stylonectria norvegica]
MTVKNEGDVYPTDSLILKKDRKHYRIPVRSQHWQLRSLVSAEKQNFIYFPGGNGSNHVQRLNTTTHECETIKLLTFAPRCLVAENGWLCCGSENGDFVAMQLDELNDTNDDGRPRGSDDAGLSLGLSSSVREESIFSLISRARRSNTSLIAKSMKLAKDRVNCITLWFPPTALPAYDTAYSEPVAILANNDRTVTLVSLQDFDRKEKTEPLEVITYPDFVNRAIISPDGRFLIAILDDPYLYVHERTKKLPESGTAQSGDAEYQWEGKQRILLKSQRKDDKSDSRGSFAACFSNSGAYLAVGTQHGTISVFNAVLLSDPTADPLITTFQSSRPQSGPGAVRDMAFCPGPYDILAWTEDRGNVGVTDIRSNFIVRQITNLGDPGFEHINILDRNTIDPRLLDSRRERRSEGLASALGSNLTLSESRRRGAEALDTFNTPLSANETMVLEAIQTDRRRRREQAARRAAAQNDRSSAVPAPSWVIRRNVAGENESQRPSDRRSSNIGGDIDIGMRGIRPNITGNRRAEQGWMDSLGETVAVLREQRERQDSSYLTVLEILQARERERSATSADRDQDDSSLLVPLVNQVVTRWEESAIRGTLSPDYGVFEVPPAPDNTAGMAWSDDGRILYVGAQNGIYELHLNVQGRKFCSSVSMR